MLIVRGGNALEGTVSISGAKNGVLPLLAATAAVAGEYLLQNCPNLTDVDATLEILSQLGCKTQRNGREIYVDSRSLSCCEIPRELMLRLRSSVVFLGALLARCGRARLWLPGGCQIGERPIDLHLMALRRLGAAIMEEGASIIAEAPKLTGETVILPYPSVGATENVLLAAMGCREPVTLLGAAAEPEITALCSFLCAAGAKIDAIGGSVLVIHPPASPRAVTFSVLPDRMEAATYLCALAACGGDICMKNVHPSDLQPVLDTLSAAGVEITTQKQEIRARGRGLLRVPTITTAPFPGFPTDAQPPMVAALTGIEGTVLVKETVFANRFQYVPALCSMGARILVPDSRTAVVTGVPKLSGAHMAATDLRGGAAMVVAALCAEGCSSITNTHFIFRGYDSLCHKLTQIGAQIQETSEEHE